LEARLSEEKDRRERERIGGEIEGIKKRLKDTATAFAPIIAGLCDATEAAAAVAPEARELNSFLLSVATEVDIVIEYLLLRCARATLCWTCRSRSSRRPSCRKRMIAYSFFQHGYVATKRREKKNQRRIGSARQLDLTVKRRDPNAPIRVALDDFRCPRCNSHVRTRICRIGVFDALILCGSAAAVTPAVSPATVQGPFSPPWPPQPLKKDR
jgi:hypothetical protein